MHKSYDQGEPVTPQAEHKDAGTAGKPQSATPELGRFHISDDNPRTNFTGPVIGGLVVAILLGAAAYYFYSNYTPPPHQVISGNELPQPTLPDNVAPAAPPPVTAVAPATPNTGSNSALAHSPYATLSKSQQGAAAKSK